MSETGRDVDSPGISRAELKRLPLTVGRGLASKIDHYIEDRATGAAYEFPFDGGFGLVVQAAQRAPLAVEGETALDKILGEAVPGELALAEGAGEEAAI